MALADDDELLASDPSLHNKREKDANQSSATMTDDSFRSLVLPATFVSPFYIYPLKSSQEFFSRRDAPLRSMRFIAIPGSISSCRS